MENQLVSRNPRLSDQDEHTLQDYKSYLYTEALEDENEPDVIKDEAYYAMVDIHHDQLLDVVADRRKHTLKTALDTFNRLQGIKLSKLTDKKLNLT